MIRSRRVMSIGFLISCSFLHAPQATARGTYTPKAVASRYYDRKAAPVLRIKAGDTGKMQTPVPSPAAQDEKQPIVYVKHLESPVRYPPLARQTRLTGTIVIKLTIAADGSVLTTESSVGDKNTTGFEVLKDEAEESSKRGRLAVQAVDRTLRMSTPSNSFTNRKTVRLPRASV